MGTDSDRHPNSAFRIHHSAFSARRSFVWACGRPQARAPYPQLVARRAASGCLFGLAGGGVCRAADVTTRAVRSYRTFSPSPEKRRNTETRKHRNKKRISAFGLFHVSAFPRLSVFCGTVPRLAPGWRYQPPYPVQFGLSSRRAWLSERSPSPTPPEPRHHRRNSAPNRVSDAL